MSLKHTCRLLMLLPLLWLCGCGASLEDYRGQQPGWDLARFFDGKLVAHGLVTDRSGEVTSRFRVEMQGRWREGKGELFEQFYFDDGRRQTRTWFLSKGGWPLARHGFRRGGGGGRQDGRLCPQLALSARSGAARRQRGAGEFR